MILMIFLPALIFDSGFNLSWYTFRKELVQVIQQIKIYQLFLKNVKYSLFNFSIPYIQILLLAGPGIVLAAVIQAVFFSFVMGYSVMILFLNHLPKENLFILRQLPFRICFPSMKAYSLEQFYQPLTL